jgi:hypothetical protein
VTDFRITVHGEQGEMTEEAMNFRLLSQHSSGRYAGNHENPHWGGGRERRERESFAMDWNVAPDDFGVSHIVPSITLELRTERLCYYWLHDDLTLCSSETRYFSY